MTKLSWKRFLVLSMALFFSYSIQVRAKETDIETVRDTVSPTGGFGEEVVQPKARTVRPIKAKTGSDTAKPGVVAPTEEVPSVSKEAAGRKATRRDPSVKPAYEQTKCP